MFKRGGSSFQAQGTGITSPYDTPRKNYQTGSWGEWETKTRDITKDPRGDWSYAAQGFSELGNPYKESGEAKTIGEMLYAGAAGVRGSKDKARELEQKGELAILESQAGRMLSDEERAFKAEEAAKERALKLQIAREKVTEQELKRIPLARLITEIEKGSPDLKNAVPGSFQHTYSPGIATGRALQRRKAADDITVGVIETHRWVKDHKTGKWDYNADNMSSTIPWFDPVQQRWHVFNDDGKGMATGDPVKSFLTVDEAIAYIKGGHQEIIEESETLEENNAKEENKKQTKKPYTQKDYDESIVSGQDVIDVVTNPKTWEGTTTSGDTRGYGVNQNIAQKATGGRVNYAEGSVDPLDDLKAWWKEQAWNPKDEG